MLAQITSDLWELSRPLKAPGLRLDHRMSVVHLSSEELLSRNFERVIVGHGEIVMQEGKQILRQAFGWLRPGP